MYRDSNTRSILKAVSWRLSGTVATAVIVFVFTGELKLALSVGAFELFAKMGIYYFHERIWDQIHIGREERPSFVVWFTGLSGSGKSTLAKQLVHYLKSKRLKVDYLDGDRVRSILPGIGFGKEERENHIRRIGFLASMLEKNGVITVCSFVSPYESSRQFARSQCKNFVEVHVATPLEVCEKRDVKGLYARARKGEIQNFTGISDPYEAPTNPEIKVGVSEETEEQSLKKIVAYLDQRFK